MPRVTSWLPGWAATPSPPATPAGAVARFDEALTLWRGSPELPDSSRGVSEKTRWIEGHAALVEDRADALLATGRAAEIIGDLEAAIADAPLRERRWGQLMLALYRAGRQGESLALFNAPDRCSPTSSASTPDPSFAGSKPPSSRRMSRWKFQCHNSLR